MTPSQISVIVVSRHRPAALQRCLLGLMQQDHTDFEVIVVADPQAATEVAALAKPIKLVPFDQANISAARNAGLAQAAGAVVAFIDDDAVAEPTWLSRLVAPFSDARVIASTGYVRGRNGISYQWKACEIGADAQDHALQIETVTLRAGTPLRAVKTQGTNCAFRADTLRAIGGFDPSFWFYLDEADVNLRMAPLGLTAIVPEAQVHHGFEASARRAANRVPLSLFDIAASTALFLRRHQPSPDLEAGLRQLSQREAQRLTQHRAAGRLDQQAEIALLLSMTQGWAKGSAQQLSDLTPLAPPQTRFLHFPSLGPSRGVILSGRIWQKAALLRAAQSHAQSSITTVICLSPTARPHQMRFQPQGFWLQTGGLFGRSTREAPRLILTGFRKRISQESARIAPFRPVN
jgi:O-antigen biosynthesis protein